jgi:hypothetical protein
MCIRDRKDSIFKFNQEKHPYNSEGYLPRREHNGCISEHDFVNLCHCNFLQDIGLSDYLFVTVEKKFCRAMSNKILHIHCIREALCTAIPNCQFEGNNC